MENPNSPRAKKNALPLLMRERILLHQVHPAKLVVDWGTGFASVWLFWEHNITAALIVGFIPSILISVYLILRTDLSRYRESPLGRYFLSPRTRPGDPARLLGLAVMWGGAYYNSIPAAAAGLVIILGAWGKGLFVKKRREPPAGSLSNRRPPRGPEPSGR
ncbi:MAG TPA: hypothetical protein VMF59_10280 [Bacteroidota bacterium]|nr:hypothetical protein [Bacteroidota bacterium]